MPEIAEVARLVYFLRQHLVGKKIARVQAPDDANIFGKVGCSGPAFETALKDRKVIEAGSQGKYFWLRLSDPGPHAVMHLGMTGWIHVRNDRTAYTNYYKKMKPEEQEAWPPKYWKFQLETEGKSPVRIAFTDPRRFGRIRLVDCPGDQIRKHSPLAENGPDPVVDKDVFTEEFLRNKMRSRHVPVKALILDQAVISGVGNWVADESLYHAKLHPEQYCDEFSDDEIKRLHESIRYVCQTAVDLLGDSDQFPDHWLFNHRWGKGKKAASALPNGERLAFITVGGRTSCFAPAVQRKTGHIVPGIKEKSLENDEAERATRVKAKKSNVEDSESNSVEPKTDKRRSRKSKAQDADEAEEGRKPRKKARIRQEDEKLERQSSEAKPMKKVDGTEVVANPGRRRSSRLNKGA